MLNGVACGMIYRPLKATTRKPDIDTPASDGVRRSTFQPSALEDKQYVGAASSSSLSPGRTAITSDVSFVGVKASNSISRSMHAVTDVTPSLTKVNIQCAVKDFICAIIHRMASNWATW